MVLIFDEPASSSSWKKFVALGTLVLAGFGLIGQTLASNVTLGSGAPLEFGQGVQRLVSCSPEAPIFVTPNNNFKNASGNAGLFQFSGISFAGIQNSCVGFDFVIRAYGLTGGPLPLFGGNKSEIRVYQSNGDQFSKSVNDSFTISSQTFGAFTVTFDNPVTPSADVYRITLETFPHDSTMIRYRIGDTGPGGGVIFLTPTSQSNSTGQYFEASRSRLGIGIWCDQWPLDIPQANRTAIGSGKLNTDDINSVCSSGAAFLASGFSGGGFSGWFLPSKDELLALSNSGVLNVVSGDYWSSSQMDDESAITVTATQGSVGVFDKIMSLSVIPVRSFS